MGAFEKGVYIGFANVSGRSGRGILVSEMAPGHWSVRLDDASQGHEDTSKTEPGTKGYWNVREGDMVLISPAPISLDTLFSREKIRASLLGL